MLKTKTWIIITALCAAALGLITYLLLSGRGGSTVAQIVQNGEVIEEIDLARVTKEYSFTVVWDGPDAGSNTVQVRPGAIRVLDADCPDRICVSQGWLTDGPSPIICMPHRLIIKLKSPSGADAVSQ